MRKTNTARIVTIATALAMTLGLTTGTQAASLIVAPSSNSLLGADGVDIDGTLYDVRFKDGRCDVLFGSSQFGGCDAASTFDFTTSTEALAAADALLGQVFLDLNPSQPYDSISGLTSGCGTDRCYVIIPFAVTGNELVHARAYNWSSGTFNEDSTEILSSSFLRTFDTGFNLGYTYATFTAAIVPLPAAGWMLISGLGAFGLMRRLRRWSAR